VEGSGGFTAAGAAAIDVVGALEESGAELAAVGCAEGVLSDGAELGADVAPGACACDCTVLPTQTKLTKVTASVPFKIRMMMSLSEFLMESTPTSTAED
jgi:hypothetical protein